MKKVFNENKMSPPTVNAGVNASFAGHFKLEVHREHGESRGVVAEFDNMILDVGLLALINGNSSTEECRLGTSSAPVSAEQVGLISPLSGATAKGSRVAGAAVGGSPYLFTETREYRFGKGRAAGVIAEIGVGEESYPYRVFCRALVTDAEGLPTTITVADDEFLTVTYTLACYVDVEDKPFTLNLSSGAHDGILRLSGLPAVPGVSYVRLWRGILEPSSSRVFYGASELGDIHGEPRSVEGGSNSSMSVSSPYGTAAAVGDPRDSVLEIGLTSGNGSSGVSGISALRLAAGVDGAIGYQMSFDPPIPKTEEHVFRLRIRQTVGRR